MSFGHWCVIAFHCLLFNTLPSKNVMMEPTDTVMNVPCCEGHRGGLQYKQYSDLCSSLVIHQSTRTAPGALYKTLTCNAAQRAFLLSWHLKNILNIRSAFFCLFFWNLWGGVNPCLTCRVSPEQMSYVWKSVGFVSNSIIIPASGPSDTTVCGCLFSRRLLDE